MEPTTWLIIGIGILLLLTIAGVGYYLYRRRQVTPALTGFEAEALLTGGLINPGYFHSTYFPGYYWQDDYWTEYGTGGPPAGGKGWAAAAIRRRRYPRGWR